VLGTTGSSRALHYAGVLAHKSGTPKPFACRAGASALMPDPGDGTATSASRFSNRRQVDAPRCVSACDRIDPSHGQSPIVIWSCCGDGTGRRSECRIAHKPSDEPEHMMSIPTGHLLSGLKRTEKRGC